jgi:hypothetical protein
MEVIEMLIMKKPKEKKDGYLMIFVAGLIGGGIMFFGGIMSLILYGITPDTLFYLVGGIIIGEISNVILYFTLYEKKGTLLKTVFMLIVAYSLTSLFFIWIPLIIKCSFS